MNNILHPEDIATIDKVMSIAGEIGIAIKTSSHALAIVDILLRHGVIKPSSHMLNKFSYNTYFYTNGRTITYGALDGPSLNGGNLSHLNILYLKEP